MGNIINRKGCAGTPCRGNHKWADRTVKNIVHNKVYIGNMVQGNSGTLFYKSRKLVNKEVSSPGSKPAFV
ncbi:MAG: recombinase family protein [Acetatifactor sp.]|nr:recombinase family protein [Acetatifactor sp.]